jgi:hypothetical protein
MKQTQKIPETFLGVGYTRDRAGLPLEAVRVPVPQPAAEARRHAGAHGLDRHHGWAGTRCIDEA